LEEDYTADLTPIVTIVRRDESPSPIREPPSGMLREGQGEG